MSHAAQLGFFRAVALANEDLVSSARLLEVGSYDVNGTVRELFSGAREYVGVDLVAGPGVDVVTAGHEIGEPDGSYDVVISGECFEHDPHWRETFANMVRLARPGGLVAFTCASRGRPEHGTRRSTVGDSPGSQSVGWDYYRNLTAHDFESLPLGDWFSEHRFWGLRTSFDLYFAGVRRGASGGVLPRDSDVQELRHSMSGAHRLVRLPLRLLSASGLSEERYQDIAVPYWKMLLRGARALDVK